MMLVILFSLKSIESLENCLQTPFWSIMAELLQLNVELGSVYTKRQRQLYSNSAMTLVILSSLKSVERVENGLQIPFWSIIKELSMTIQAHSDGASFSHCGCIFESNYWRSQSHSVTDIHITHSM